MYKLIKNTISGEVDVVLNTQTGGYIPMNSENTDYQAYLKWVAEGNTPQPAE